MAIPALPGGASVSVILIVRNGASYIAQALASVCQSQLLPAEILVMETLLARREIFGRVGRFDPRFPVGEDTDWFARARDAGLGPVVLPEVLVRKRVHGGNASLSAARTNDLLLRALRHSIARKRGEGDCHV